MMMAASLRMATLFPCCAMRPRRPADDLMEVVMLEKTSFCPGSMGQYGTLLRRRPATRALTLLSITPWSRALS